MPGSTYKENRHDNERSGKTGNRKDQKDRGRTRRKQLRRIRDGWSSGTGRGQYSRRYCVQHEKSAEIAWEKATKEEKENKDLKKTVEKREATISELNTKLCNAIAEAKANEIPEELVQELYCMAYDKEAELIGKMERAADQMTEATIAGEDAHGFAEEYKKQKENRNRYRKVMEILDERERRRAGRDN